MKTQTGNVITGGRPDPERFRRALEFMDDCLYRKNGCPVKAEVIRAVSNKTGMETHPIRQKRDAVSGRQNPQDGTKRAGAVHAV